MTLERDKIIDLITNPKSFNRRTYNNLLRVITEYLDNFEELNPEGDITYEITYLVEEINKVLDSYFSDDWQDYSEHRFYVPLLLELENYVNKNL
jgi:hypothetical protein